MLRSTISKVSAPATCLFRGSITNPTQLLFTLRGRRYRRLTQHLLPGGPLRPYPGRSFTGWTAPAFVCAFGKSGGAKTTLAGMTAVAISAAVALRMPPQLPPDISRLVEVPPGSPTESRIRQCMVMLTVGDRDFSPECIARQRPLIAVLGDSTAAALVPGLSDLQSRHRFGIAQFAMAGCQPLIVKAYGVSDDCLRRNLNVLKLLADTRPDIVLFHALLGGVRSRRIAAFD
jgi:hypothetical protein